MPAKTEILSQRRIGFCDARRAIRAQGSRLVDPVDMRGVEWMQAFGGGAARRRSAGRSAFARRCGSRARGRRSLGSRRQRELCDQQVHFQPAAGVSFPAGRGPNWRSADGQDHVRRRRIDAARSSQRPEGAYSKRGRTPDRGCRAGTAKRRPAGRHVIGSAARDPRRTSACSRRCASARSPTSRRSDWNRSSADRRLSTRLRTGASRASTT